MIGRADDRLPTEHIAIYGATGSGKTLATKALLRALPKSKPVYFWDPDNSHRAHFTAATPSDWIRLIAQRKGGAFVPEKATPEYFGFWCTSIWEVIGADTPCAAVVEELGQVTNAAKAPRQWHQLVTRGRKYALQLIVVAQRPQEADKTILSNKAVLITGYLDRLADCKLIASELMVSPDVVANLGALNAGDASNRHLLARQSGQDARPLKISFKHARPLRL